jgi:hypothetical protein
LYHLQGPHPKLTTFVFKVRRLSGCWLTESHWLSISSSACTLAASTSLRRVGTCPHDTTAPSTITWMAINGRLGTGRLGTVISVYYL